MLELLVWLIEDTFLADVADVPDGLVGDVFEG